MKMHECYTNDTCTSNYSTQILYRPGNRPRLSKCESKNEVHRGSAGETSRGRREKGERNNFYRLLVRHSVMEEAGDLELGIGTKDKRF